MPWYVYLLEFLSGALLANGIPHFVQGMCGHRFQSPFATPSGVGESSPLVNVLWGFANLAGGAVLLCRFVPQMACGWLLVGLGILLTAVFAAIHFGKVRTSKPMSR